MQAYHATSRRLPVLVVILAIVAPGCATAPSPAPPAANAAATAMPTAAPVSPEPTVESAATVPPGAVPEAGSPSVSDWVPVPYGREDRPFLYTDIATSAQLVVDVSDLRDMAGHDLVMALDYYPSPSEALGSQLLRLPIDMSPYAVATKPMAVPSGHFMLWIFAGQRPCWMGYGPRCEVSGSTDHPPEYGCRVEVDIKPGDDRTIAVGGLPRLLPSQGASYAYPACSVAADS